MTSVITNRDRDCLGCRLVSGTGLIGIGAYLGFQVKNNKTATKAGKTLVYGVAAGVIGMGLARIFNLPPFYQKPEQ